MPPQRSAEQRDHSVRTSYMSRSMPCLPEEAAACSASATPSQAGRMRRVCVQAKIQGMARREVTSLVALRLHSRGRKKERKKGGRGGGQVSNDSGDGGQGGDVLGGLAPAERGD